jgi:uncharacterized membrane protein
LLSLAALFAMPSSLWACPMCKMALESDDPQPRAYMISILFMLGTISTVFGCVGALMLWVNRYEKKALTEAGYEHLFVNGVPVPMSKPTEAQG